MKPEELTRLVVERIADKLGESVEKMRPLTLAEVAELLREVACRHWDTLEPPQGVVKSEGCVPVPANVEEYLSKLPEELKALADHLVDIAMEALAKHVESLEGGLYARLSWLLVSHSSRVAHRLLKLASLIHVNPALVEFAAVLIALRAIALYRFIAKQPSDKLAKLIDSLEAIVAGMDAEEETLVEKLSEGVVVEPG